MSKIIYKLLFISVIILCDFSNCYSQNNAPSIMVIPSNNEAINEYEKNINFSILVQAIEMALIERGFTPLSLENQITNMQEVSPLSTQECIKNILHNNLTEIFVKINAPFKDYDKFNTSLTIQLSAVESISGIIFSQEMLNSGDWPTSTDWNMVIPGLLNLDGFIDHFISKMQMNITQKGRGVKLIITKDQNSIVSMDDVTLETNQTIEELLTNWIEGKSINDIIFKEVDPDQRLSELNRYESNIIRIPFFPSGEEHYSINRFSRDVRKSLARIYNQTNDKKIRPPRIYISGAVIKLTLP